MDRRTGNLAVIGLQWGDEGKGKIIDFLAKDFDINARFQGGPNAGHTVIHEKRKFVFHQIPAGILNRNVTGLIGAGCVLDPRVFLSELADVEKADPDIRKRLKLSKFSHLIFPYHKMIDRLKEEKKGDERIGTTQRGMGPVYEDKYGRVGIRLGEVLDEDGFRKKLKASLSYKNFLLMELYQGEPLDEKKVFEEYRAFGENVRGMVVDDAYYLNQEMNKGRRVLFEGAQGTFLDIDYGTYPYVTSSHTVAGGAAVGLGVAPFKVERVLGVAKAYVTRVGAGPFPTELEGSAGESLRKRGGEFGATTGRPRRCGHFDIPLVKYGAMLNGVQEIALTKLDILDGEETVRICLDYVGMDHFDPMTVDRAKSSYLEMPGWTGPTTGVGDFAKLGINARKYVEEIEVRSGLKVSMISVGGETEAMIVR